MSEELGAVQEQTFAGATRATAEPYPPERRLSARQTLTGAFAVIGSRRPNGRPHAAVSSYVRRGRDFWLPTVGRGDTVPLVARICPPGARFLSDRRSWLCRRQPRRPRRVLSR